MYPNDPNNPNPQPQWPPQGSGQPQQPYQQPGQDQNYQQPPDPYQQQAQEQQNWQNQQPQPNPQPTQDQGYQQPFDPYQQQAYQPHYQAAPQEQQQSNYPANWQPPQDNSVDYLEKIAPTNTTRGFTGKQLGLLAGLVVVLLGAFFGMMAFGGGSSRENLGEQAQRLVAYNNSLSDVADTAQNNIRSSELASLNGTLRVYLNNNARELGQLLGVDHENAPAILEDTTTEAMLEKHDDARLAGTFDSVYVTDLRFQLAQISALLEAVHERTSSDEIKEAIDKAYSDLGPLREQLDEIEIQQF